MATKLIVTGATGMVGEGVLHECLLSDAVEKVLVVGRKSCGVVHPKLKEIIHKDFFNLFSIQSQLTGYDGCLFCLGISSVGVKESVYFERTYKLTLHFADIYIAVNPGSVFCYISGAGTDSSGEGKIMWARVKGQTENTLSKMPFKSVYNFRPGFLKPTPGLKNTLSLYKYFGWLYPVFNKVAPKYFSTLKQLGRAMINAVLFGYEKNVLEVPDIITLSEKTS
jgi:uncharacterized protein YbjT (DUF2867 family)